MKEYLLAVIGMILFSAVITTLLSDGKIASSVKALCRMACVLTLTSPLILIFQKESNFLEVSKLFFQETGIDIDTSFIQYYSNQRIAYAQSAIEEELVKKYGVSCKVELVCQVLETGELKIQKIYLQTEAEKEVENLMSEYLSRNYCSEVLIE